METALPKISHQKHLALVKNYEAAASLVKLIYVSDLEAGIIRKRKAKGFSYLVQEKTIKDKLTIERIKKLAIPPVWTGVWICKKENGHIQATGLDGKKKQYHYHSLWNMLRNETKFHKMEAFGKALPALRLQLEKDLALNELCEKKVLAAVIGLMERTYIRVGNSTYEKLNGSHGLTTLHDKHVKIEGSSLAFSFIGKKGIQQDVTLNNKKLASVVKQCRDIPGKELFQYYDATGNRKSIDSGMVNSYIKEITGQDYSAKDFRTWAGCLHFLMAFSNIALLDDELPTKSGVNDMLDVVSKKLGNTRTVCRKYYVHPGLIKWYEENKLKNFIKELDTIEEEDNVSGLTAGEKVLMKLLEKIN
jgi:DNA topoisomerase-1